MTETEAIIAALRLEAAEIEEICQGEPFNMMALEFIQRLIDKLSTRTPDEHTAHAEAMVRVVAKALLYEAADERFRRTDQTKSDYSYTQRGRFQAHKALLSAIRDLRGKQ